MFDALIALIMAIVSLVLNTGTGGAVQQLRLDLELSPAGLVVGEVSFTGTLDSMGADVWVVSGVEVQVGTDTELDQGLQVGDMVGVEAMVLADGDLLATEIRASDAEDAVAPGEEVTDCQEEAREELARKLAELDREREQLEREAAAELAELEEEAAQELADLDREASEDDEDRDEDEEDGDERDEVEDEDADEADELAREREEILGKLERERQEIESELAQELQELEEERQELQNEFDEELRECLEDEDDEDEEDDD